MQTIQPQKPVADYRPTMQLTKAERNELVIEIFLTVSTVFFLYLSVILIFRELINYQFYFNGILASLKMRLALDSKIITIAYWVISLVSMIVCFLFTRWRIQRRIKQMKLRHVLDYLRFIAKGNYDTRIPLTDMGEMNDVVSNINHLVDSTVEAMEEERKAEKTKDELISNIGHDIRTPLTSIIGYLGLIENKQYHSEEEMLQYTHTAYTKAIHMQSLVNDLFEYTASRPTIYEIKPQPVSIELFLSQLAADFELQASEQGITIDVQVAPQNLIGFMDVEKMARAFNNLISNALKYGHGATEIRLIAQTQPVKHKKRNMRYKRYFNQGTNSEMISFKVINDGEPLKPQELEQIFQRSYRGDQSRNADKPGSGLGLSIVKNIAELHQGRVYASIEDGKSTFTIEIPQINYTGDMKDDKHK